MCTVVPIIAAFSLMLAWALWADQVVSLLTAVGIFYGVGIAGLLVVSFITGSRTRPPDEDPIG